MLSTILTTKLHAPPLRPNLVPRPHLLSRLNAGLAGKLILISAPAGYGKTTLAVEWFSGLASSQAGSGARTAWLSLDENDNDPARFLTHLISALQQVSPGLGQATLEMLKAPQPPPIQAALTALINAIACLPAPLIFALDDYHLIHLLEIHRQLGFLVEHQPAQLHWIILAREDPPLPLARLRANGQIVEIRQEDLRFSLEECAGFLHSVMGLNLAPADIAALEHRTEGWIAGLQLAALSMRGRDDLSSYIDAFTGSSHYILDYLVEEVFDRQPPEMQAFLLKTSILDRFTAQLCDAVACQKTSREMLQVLDQSNLFIIPLDQTHTWYRYHRLFAELLRQRLSLAEAISENELHRLASQWFLAQGFTAEAIQHALAASEWESAAQIISDNSVQLLRRGELVTLLGWLKSLPDEGICNRPQLCRDFGWALCLTGQMDAAQAYLRRAQEAAQGDEALLGTILVAQAYNQRARGDNPGAIQSAQRALALLPASDPLSRSLVALTLGLAHWHCRNLPEADQALVEADRTAQQSQNHYVRMTALTYRGAIQAAYGRLHPAAELCRQVIQLGAGSPPIAPAHIELGALLYEWNDLEAAAFHLQTGIDLCQRTGNVVIQNDGYRLLALLQAASGDHAAASDTLIKVDQLTRDHEASPLTLLRNAVCHVLLALAQNDLASAQFWADQIHAPAEISLSFPRMGLVPARLLLARDEKTLAAEKLRDHYADVSQAGCTYAAIEICTLQALAASEPGEALQYLETALRKARPEGFIRTFLDKGQPMQALLKRLRLQSGDLKDYIQTLLAAYGETGQAPTPQTLLEPLSHRELEVLRLMSQGFSNREIAQRLVLTPGTVKSHIHHILGKLSCSSRTQAVAKARQLALL